MDSLQFTVEAAPGILQNWLVGELGKVQCDVPLEVGRLQFGNVRAGGGLVALDATQMMADGTADRVILPPTPQLVFTLLPLGAERVELTVESRAPVLLPFLPYLLDRMAARFAMRDSHAPGAGPAQASTPALSEPRPAGRPGGRNTDRDRAIYEARECGDNPKYIAKLWGISVSRVQQIVREQREQGM